MANKILKPSRYNYAGHLTNGTVLAVNFLTSAVLNMSRDDYNRLNAMSVTKEEEEVLSANGFYVAEDEDELAKVVALRNANNFSSSQVSFQILPTTLCNARCFYCYEEGFSPCAFDEKHENELVAFIERTMQAAQKLHITWFGGEPLLRPDFIERVSMRLMESADSRGITFEGDVITNGSLVTDEVAKLLKRCRVRNAQITLDGTNEEYQRRKNYLDSSITLDDVLGSIERLLDNEIAVSVRLNMDKRNHEDLLSLIPLLGARFAQNDFFSAHVAPLYSLSVDNSCYESEELAEAYKPILRAMIDAGLIRSLNGLPLNFNNASCCAQGINNFCISPEGFISKCDHLIGDPGDRIGSLSEGVAFNGSAAFWAQTSIPDQCCECVFLPTCQTGCYAGEKMGFGYGRCPYIKFIYEAVFDAASYLIERNM